jgi:pyruvate formate lyase activating enzyme
MIFGGLQPVTLVDFPGQVACTVFAQGCNFRCGYCHNGQLIDPLSQAAANAPTEEELLAMLERRRRALDGVVVSGGEPTIQAGLLSFLEKVKAMGFLVKLDTNGTKPTVLRDALARSLVDYVAMDVKHDPAKYSEITGVSVDVSQLEASRDLLISSGVGHEFRTTVLPHFHDTAAVESIARFCAGASRLVFQGCVPTRALTPAFRKYSPPTLDQLQRLKRVAEQFVERVELSATSHIRAAE